MQFARSRRRGNTDGLRSGAGQAPDLQFEVVIRWKPSVLWPAQGVVLRTAPGRRSARKRSTKRWREIVHGGVP